jgi:hypothetical protein
MNKFDDQRGFAGTGAADIVQRQANLLFEYESRDAGLVGLACIAGHL